MLACLLCVGDDSKAEKTFVYATMPEQTFTITIYYYDWWKVACVCVCVSVCACVCVGCCL